MVYLQSKTVSTTVVIFLVLRFAVVILGPPSNAPPAPYEDVLSLGETVFTGIRSVNEKH